MRERAVQLVEAELADSARKSGTRQKRSLSLADPVLPTPDAKCQDSTELNLLVTTENTSTRRSTGREQEVDTWSETERKKLLAGHSRNSRTTASDSSSCSNPRNRPPHALSPLPDLQR